MEPPYLLLEEPTFLMSDSVRLLSREDGSEFSVLLNLNTSTCLLFGILLTTIGSSLMAFGSTLMKLGLHLEAKKQQRQVTYPCCEPTWWSGLTGYTLGALLHIVALGFAPASVLAPMNSVGLIANAVAAATILREQFGWVEAVSTTGTVVGVTLCAVASFMPHGTHTSWAVANEMKYPGLFSWRDPWYLTYLGVCLVCGFGVLIYVNSEESATVDERDLLHHKLIDNSRKVGPSTLPEEHEDKLSEPLGDRKSDGSAFQPLSISGPCIGPLGSLNEFNDLPRYPITIGVSYGFLAGLVGAQCVLEVKEIVCCLQYGVDLPEIWNSPQPYLCLMFLLVAVWLQIHFLNLGLARGEATIVVPTYYVFWTFFGTFGGFTKFHEVEGFSTLSAVFFSLGFALTVACIAILAVQEMTNLRKYVDERVPDMPEEQMDLAMQEMQDKQLGSQVTLAMGLFPFSMLGRTVGRKRFRPLYQRFRRTRSTASDTALGDAHGEYTIGHSGSPVAPYTLPHSLHLYQIGRHQGTTVESSSRGGYVNYSPYADGVRHSELQLLVKSPRHKAAMSMEWEEDTNTNTNNCTDGGCYSSNKTRKRGDYEMVRGGPTHKEEEEEEIWHPVSLEGNASLLADWQNVRKIISLGRDRPSTSTSKWRKG